MYSSGQTDRSVLRRTAPKVKTNMSRAIPVRDLLAGPEIRVENQISDSHDGELDSDAD